MHLSFSTRSLFDMARDLASRLAITFLFSLSKIITRTLLIRPPTELMAAKRTDGVAYRISKRKKELSPHWPVGGLFNFPFL